MSKAPELYRQSGNRYSNEREPINPMKIAIWNSLYYRHKGGRKAYVVRPVPERVRRQFGRRAKYTRWQLEYDLQKPWHVAARYPKDFETFALAVEYAFSKQALEGPFKYDLNTPIVQGELFQ